MVCLQQCKRCTNEQSSKKDPFGNGGGTDRPAVLIESCNHMGQR
jgi:hypothetical protein